MRASVKLRANFLLLPALLLAITVCKKTPDLTGQTGQEARRGKPEAALSLGVWSVLLL